MEQFIQNNNTFLDVIYDGQSYQDSTHLDSIYRSFKEPPGTGDEETTSGNHLERIKLMKQCFVWNPVPQQYFKRFQKSPEISTCLRERGNNWLYSTEEEDSLEKALRGYNLAIAFGPSNSFELALAYERRADLLIRLEEPELAQEDIHSAARNTSYPTKSAQKLIELQTRCTASLHSKRKRIYLEEIQEENTPSGFGEKMKNKEIRKFTTNQFYKLKSKNPSVSGMADCTEIDYQPHCGRRVVVNREVKPGEVLMIDEPYALILEKMLKWDMEHCTNCSKPILSGVPCNECTFGWFCSKSCQDIASRGIHKHEHNYLSYLKCNPIMSVKCFLAGRILFKTGCEELYRIFKTKDPLYFTQSESDPKYRGYSLEGNYSSTSYLPIFHLISHPNATQVSKAKSNTFKSLVMTYLITESSDFFSRFEFNEDFKEFQDFFTSLILRHMDSIEYNAITLSQILSNKQTLRYGAGIYPVLCLINHSCDPNCVPVRSVKHLKTSVIAMKTLHPGEEITFSYAPHFSQMEMVDRRKFLFDKYNFLCGCEACSNQWGPGARSWYVPEAQCNACARYLLTGQCPKCVQRDFDVKRDLSLWQSRLIEGNMFLEKGDFFKAFEMAIKALTFCSEYQLQGNFVLSLEFQELFKNVMVGLVSL